MLRAHKVVNIFILKKYFLLFVFWLLFARVNAQYYNYHEFGVGFGFSSTKGYTNVARENNNFAANINTSYNFSPYLPFTAELQYGKLSGGGTTINLDRYGRQYVNNYLALIIHGDLHLGELIDYYDSDILGILKNFYSGTGFGVVFNNNTVQRINLYPQDGSLDYIFPGKDKSVNLLVPLRFGYEYIFYNDLEEPFISLDLGYQHNLVFGSGLDGYNDDPKLFKHNAID